jgi:hypothetical protein
MKNCVHISKLGLWVEIFCDLFCGHYHWYKSTESIAICKFKKFGWKFIKFLFFSFFDIKAKYYMYFFLKTNTKWKNKRFYSWVLHYFFKFLLFSNVLELKTRGLMTDKKLHIIYVMYIDFIQSFSSNHWI